MSPEFGATSTLFPIDDETLTYLRLDRPTARAPRARRGVRQGAGPVAPPGRTRRLRRPAELDLASVEPSVAGPRRPQDRVPLTRLRENFRSNFPDGLAAHRASLGRTPVDGGGVVEEASAASFPASDPPSFTAGDGDGLEAPPAEPWWPGRPGRTAGLPAVAVEVGERPVPIRTGSVAIAAITSCTNTSNPTVMVGAGLLARNAVARGLRVPPTVKTSLAPGSKAVTGYLEDAGLMAPLEALGFALAGYGCTTCIGNSGPLDEPSPRRSSRTSWSSPPSCPATATSRAGSIPSRARATSPRRRSSSPSRLPAGSTST